MNKEELTKSILDLDGKAARNTSERPVNGHGDYAHRSMIDSLLFMALIGCLAWLIAALVNS